MTQAGRPNGPGRSAPFARWFRYPAGFSPPAMEAALDWVDPASGALLVDPFAGLCSGIDSTDRDFRFVGIEAHPLVAEIGSLRFLRFEDFDGLEESARRVAACAPAKSTEGEHDLVRRCFSDSVLRDLVGMRRQVARTEESFRPFLRCALLAILREAASARVGWPHQRPALARRPIVSNVRRRFLQRVEWFRHDLTASERPRGKLVCGDSRGLKAWRVALGPRRADACISSPPYLNNYDYADATRLELFFWRLAGTWSEMVQFARSGMVTASTQQTSRRGSLFATQSLQRWPTLASELKAITEALAAQRKKRGRGKEYDQLVPMYFRDIAAVLQHLRAALKAEARAALVVGDSAPYGVHVDTPRLVADIAGLVGFELAGVTRLRSRGTRWRTNGSRHMVGLTESVVLLTRPSDSQTRA